MYLGENVFRGECMLVATAHFPLVPPNELLLLKLKNFVLANSLQILIILAFLANTLHFLRNLCISYQGENTNEKRAEKEEFIMLEEKRFT